MYVHCLPTGPSDSGRIRLAYVCKCQVKLKPGSYLVRMRLQSKIHDMDNTFEARRIRTKYEPASRLRYAQASTVITTFPFARLSTSTACS